MSWTWFLVAGIFILMFSVCKNQDSSFIVYEAVYIGTYQLNSCPLCHTKHCHNHAWLHCLSFSEFLYSCMNPRVNFILESAAMWLCHVALYDRCSTVSSLSVHASQRTHSELLHVRICWQSAKIMVLALCYYLKNFLSILASGIELIVFDCSV